MSSKQKKRLSQAESSFWNKILMRHVQEKMQDNPDISISDVYATAYKEFLDEKWICLVPQNSNGLSEDEYLALHDKFGPDLTAIPRCRYSFLSGKRSQNNAPKKITPFNKFVKEYFKQPDTVKNFKDAAAKWKLLTPEQRKIYETV